MENKMRSAEDWVIDITAAVLAVIIFVLTVYPIYYCLINSLNDGMDAAKGGIYLWPRKFSLENYKIVFKNTSLYWAFFMTILRTVVGTIVAVAGLSMAAYALSKKELVFRRFYMAFGIVTLYFSASAVHSYLLYRQLGMLDTFWVYILPNVYQFYYIILFVSFFQQLPPALVDSARVDGAGEFTILYRIILPMSAPVIATISLFVGVWHWNDWFHPAFFVNSESLMTLPAVLMRAMSLTEAQQTLQKYMSQPAGQSSVTMESVRYAMLIVSVLPITLVYPFVQKYFVKGMTLGSVKE